MVIWSKADERRPGCKRRLPPVFGSQLKGTGSRTRALVAKLPGGSVFDSRRAGWDWIACQPISRHGGGSQSKKQKKPLQGAAHTGTRRIPRTCLVVRVGTVRSGMSLGTQRLDALRTAQWQLGTAALRLRTACGSEMASWFLRLLFFLVVFFFSSAISTRQSFSPPRLAARNRVYLSPGRRYQHHDANPLFRV